MVRTLEDDIDFARCEISNALCDLESLGLSLINGEFFEFELSPNFEDALKDDILAKLYNNAHAIYYKILGYINEWGSVCERLENLNLIDTPQDVLLHDLDIMIEDAWQAYYEKDALSFDILGTLVNVKEYVPVGLYNDLVIMAESLKDCFEEEFGNLEDAIGFIEHAKEEIKII